MKNETSKIQRCQMTEKECEAQRQKLQEFLGNDIVKRRDDLGLSQKQFVFASGIHQSTASNVEKGDTNATLDTLIRYARAYHTSVVGVLRHKAFHVKL